MIELSQWCFICGLVSAQSERLMDQRAVLGLLEADSTEELKSRLRASLLFADSPPSDLSLEELAERFTRSVRTIAESSPDDRIGDLFLLEQTWEAFRAFAKSALAEQSEARPARRQELVDTQAEIFKACWEGTVENERFQSFADAAMALRAAAEGEMDIPGMVDRIVDAQEVVTLRKTAAALNGEALKEWIDILTQLRAGLAIFRARTNGWDVDKFVVPWQEVGVDHPALKDLAAGNKDDLPFAWDKLGLPYAAGAVNAEDAPVELGRRIDNRVTELAQASNGMPFGPERVFAFLWALRSEAINLKLALLAAAFGIPEKRLAGELRISYV